VRFIVEPSCHLAPTSTLRLAEEQRDRGDYRFLVSELHQWKFSLTEFDFEARLGSASGSPMRLQRLVKFVQTKGSDALFRYNLRLSHRSCTGVLFFESSSTKLVKVNGPK